MSVGGGDGGSGGGGFGGGGFFLECEILVPSLRFTFFFFSGD